MAGQGDAAQAYVAAEAAIARVAAAGEDRLVLSGPAFHALARLPPAVQGLTGLREINLRETAISDLAPLQGLTGLQRLWLDQTGVADLRPIRDLPQLGAGPGGGVWFQNTAATARDASLQRLALIADDQQRWPETRAYLQTLPPWPQPLAWAIPAAALPDQPPAAPEADPVPRIIVGEAGLDLAPSPLDPADVTDPIKARIYARLPEAVATLHRFSNRFAELKAPTDALRALVAVPFAEADLLDIHLQLAALSDLRAADAGRSAAERLDPDAMAALDAVLRLGPPVTLGHPDVDLLEERLIAYARNRLAATVAEGERRVAAGLADTPALATARLRATAGMVANAGDEGRVAGYRRGLHRAVVVALVTVAEGVVDTATGLVIGDITFAAAQFLLLHKDAIMATAPAWGETGAAWLEYMLARANLMVRNAHPPK